MDGIKLLGGKSKYLLDVVSGLCGGLEEGIDLVLLLELNGSVLSHLTAEERLVSKIRLDEKVM